MSKLERKMGDITSSSEAGKFPFIIGVFETQFKQKYGVTC